MNNPVLYVMSAGMTVGVFMSLVFYSLALVIPADITYKTGLFIYLTF